MFNDLFTQTRLQLYLLGIIAGSSFALHTSSGFVIILIFIILIVIIYKRKLESILIFLLVAFLATFLMHLRLGFESNKTDLDFDTSFTIKISEPPEISTYAQQITGTVEGRTYILTEIERYPIVTQGDILEVQAEAIEIAKSDKFSEGYAQYLKSKGIFYFLENAAVENHSPTSFSNFRAALLDAIDSNLNSKNATLLKGLLFGNRASITSEERNDLLVSGTMHIIAASGFNVTILYIIIDTFLAKSIRKNITLILGIISICLYMSLIGLYILPALRAAIMLIYLLVAKLFHRKGSILIALQVSIVGIILLFPYALLSVSMQLSIAATLGLILFSGAISQKFQKLPLVGKSSTLTEIISASLATMLGTLPLSIAIFGSVSIIGIVSNILILPLITSITYLGIVLLIGTLLRLSFLSLLISTLLEVGLSYIRSAIEFFGAFENLLIQFQTKESSFIALGILLIFYLWYAKKNLFTYSN